MTPVQARMARAALELSLEDLAAEAALPADSVRLVEREGGKPDAASKLRATFEVAGIEFLGEDGVRFQADGARSSRTVPLDQLSAANDE